MRCNIFFFILSHFSDLTSQIQLEFVMDPSLRDTMDHSIASLDKLPLILPGYILMIKLIAVAEIRSDTGRKTGSTFSDSYQGEASYHPTLGKLTPIKIKLDSVSSCRVQI